MKRLAERTLGFAAYGADVTPDGSRIVVFSTDGRVSVFDGALEPIVDLDLAGVELHRVVLCPTGSRLGIASANHAEILGLDGRPAGSWNHARWGYGGYGGCRFSADGRVFFVAFPEGQSGQQSLAAIDPDAGKILSRHPLDLDVLCGFELALHPEGEVLAVGAQGGRDGDRVLWCTFAGDQLRVFDAPIVGDGRIVAFHPAGGEFLMVDRIDGLLRRISFPDGVVLGEHLDHGTLAGRDGFGDEAIYLSENRVLFSSANGSLFVLGLVAGTVAEVVPSQADPVRWFGPVGRERIVTNHASGTLRLWDVSGLLGPVSQPGAGLPLTRKLLSGNS